MNMFYFSCLNEVAIFLLSLVKMRTKHDNVNDLNMNGDVGGNN